MGYKIGEKMTVNFEFKRKKMVDEQIFRRGVKNEKILNAFTKVPRHLFMDEALANEAYGDYPLPIGDGQTISQPYIVALMVDLLEINEDSIVLELGTGSGYQTAILCEIAKFVYSIERVPSLTMKARKILTNLGYTNVDIKIGDGTSGWEEHSPYSGIVTSAAAPSVPQPLLNQLADGGKLVIPVGNDLSQNLKVITKSNNAFNTDDFGGCRFVKLIGKFGWGR